jgi:arylsulfatase A-like enzyme
LLDNTLLVITSDHGEEFFEHGRFGHRWNLYETTLRIPLVMWAPGLVPSGTVVRTPVRIIDVMPTILELAGLPPSPEGMGRRLGAAMAGDDSDLAPAMFAELTGGSLHLESLRGGREKLIVDFERSEVEYYDLEDDPHEREPLTRQSRQPVAGAIDRFQTLRRALAEYQRSLTWSRQRSVPMDPTTRQRLESLGYLDR